MRYTTSMKLAAPLLALVLGWLLATPLRAQTDLYEVGASLAYTSRFPQLGLQATGVYHYWKGATVQPEVTLWFEPALDVRIAAGYQFAQPKPSPKDNRVLLAPDLGVGIMVHNERVYPLGHLGLWVGYRFGLDWVVQLGYRYTYTLGSDPLDTLAVPNRSAVGGASNLRIGFVHLIRGRKHRYGY